MSKAKRLVKNSLWVMAGNLGSKVIGLIMLPLYTRWLSAADYGLSDMIVVYSTFGLSIVSCCIDQSLFIFPKDQERDLQKKYFSSGLSTASLNALVFAILCTIITYISELYNIHNAFCDNVWLIYLMVISQMYQNILQQFSRSLDNMLAYSIAGIVLTAATAGFAFIFIPSMGVKGYVLSLIIAHLCAGSFSLISGRLWRYISINSIEFSKAKSLLGYSIPLIPNGIMWWLVDAMNRPVMERYLGLHDIGIYAVANRFPGIVSMVYGVFAIAWQISVLEEYGKEGYKTFYNKVFKLVVLLMILTISLISLFSKSIIHILTTSDYYDAWKLIPLLAFGVMLSNVGAFVGTNFSAVRKSSYFFKSSVGAALTSVICNLVFIPLFGIYGACFSVLCSFLVMMATRIKYSWQYVQITNPLLYILYGILSLISIIVIICDFSLFASICTVIVFLIFLIYMERDSLIEVYKLINHKFKKQ